jgi:hypothetical protein
MPGEWARTPARLGHTAMRRFLGRTALVVGGTGAALFAGGAVVFRSRNASPIQQTEFPEAEGKTFVVTGGTSGIGALAQARGRAGACAAVGVPPARDARRSADARDADARAAAQARPSCSSSRAAARTSSSAAATAGAGPRWLPRCGVRSPAPASTCFRSISRAANQ